MKAYQGHGLAAAGCMPSAELIDEVGALVQKHGFDRVMTALRCSGPEAASMRRRVNAWRDASKRNAEAVAAHVGGETFAQIGNRLGVSAATARARFIRGGGQAERIR